MIHNRQRSSSRVWELDDEKENNMKKGGIDEIAVFFFL